MNKVLINKLKKSLPTQPGILRQHKFFNSAVLVPLVECKDGLYLLYEKRAEGIKQAGEVCFPGGAIEHSINESPLETALRESEEEINLNREYVEIIGRIDTLVNPMGITIEPYIGLISESALEQLIPNPTEVEKYFLVPLKYFLENEPETYQVRIEVRSTYLDKDGNKVELLPVNKLGIPTRYNDTWAVRKREVLVYKSPEEVIWGMTAEITHELILFIKKLI